MTKKDALAISASEPVVLSVSDSLTISEQFAKAKTAPKDFKNSPADVFLAITWGAELGMRPATALNSVVIIHGKASLYAATMHAMCKASPLCEYFVQVPSDKGSATYRTKRVGDPEPQELTFSMDDAKTANLLGSDGWKKYPQRMLEARAKSALARDVYPDILHGAYASEEIELDEYSPGDAISEFSEPGIIDAEPVPADAPDEPTAPDDGGPGVYPEVLTLRECTTREELRKVSAGFAGKFDDDSDRHAAVTAEYGAMWGRLE